MTATPRERATAWRDRARVELLAAAQPLPEGGYWSTPERQRVAIRSYDLREASACPARYLARGRDGFRWTAAIAAPTLARTALAELAGGSAATAPEAVWRALDQQAAEGTDLGDWLGGLGPGGRSAVARAVLAIVAAAPGQLHPWPPRARWYAERDRSPSWLLRGRPVRASAAYDLRAGRPRAGGDDSRLALFVGAAPDPARAELEAGHLALVATLDVGSVPVAVSVLHLQSGERTTFDVDDDLLGDALDRWIALVGVVAGALEGAPPDTRAGPHCHHCPRAADCIPGQAWLVGPAGRRRGGLLPEEP
ncbi:MAG: hypothetical protein IPM45_04525 [Acidimicrobiales bacterium]|nr:hypothetical protein [Acidimicrobiales bacterium]